MNYINELYDLDIVSMIFGCFVALICYVFIAIGNYYLQNAFYTLEKRKNLKGRENNEGDT